MSTVNRVIEIFKKAAYLLKDNYQDYIYVGAAAFVLGFLIGVAGFLGPSLYFATDSDSEINFLNSVGLVGWGISTLLSLVLGSVLAAIYVRAREVSWSLITKTKIPFKLGNIVIKGIVIWAIELVLSLIITVPFLLVMLGFIGSMLPILSEYTQILAPMSFIFFVLGIFAIPVYIILSLFLAFMPNEYVLAKHSIFESIKNSASLVMKRFWEVLIFFVLFGIVWLVLATVSVVVLCSLSLLTEFLCFGDYIHTGVSAVVSVILVFWSLTTNILFWRWLKEGK